MMQFVSTMLFHTFLTFAIIATSGPGSSEAQNSRAESSSSVRMDDAYLQPVSTKLQVTTEDGYGLEVHRITGTNSNPGSKGKQPILLMHGLLTSSVDWIITGPGRALGYILADEGYDVWMGNNRGNTFSREHKKYSVLEEDYWKFSWHEVGCSDLPAMIDYILIKTNKTELIYTGHSQGTTDFWVMATERPEYQRKIKAMFALGPVAYLDHIKSLFYRIVAQFSNNLEKLMSLIGLYEFEPTSELLKELISFVCENDSPLQRACENIIFLVSGFGSDQLNTTMLTSILAHVPAGASVRQIIHYGQVVKSGKFQQYDHGWVKNWRKYKSLRPPLYDLSRIKVPVSLHYASNDWLSDPRDVDHLYRELGNPIGKFRVPHESFGHIDFQFFSTFSNSIEKLSFLLGRYQFDPSSDVLKAIAALACHDDAWTQPLCTNIMFLIGGFGSDHLNTTMLPVILAHAPAGGAVKQFVHYLQLVRDQEFQQYDHGFWGNWKKYKQLRPPRYDLSKVKVPVYLHYSTNDWMADPTDVDHLYRELGNPVGKFLVPHGSFGHLDFAWAKDAKELLYDELISYINKYKN